jgi:integrase
MHELRHFAGTELQRARHDIKATQLFMRHKSARMTLDVYMRYDESDLVDAMKATDAVWREDAEGK